MRILLHIYLILEAHIILFIINKIKKSNIMIVLVKNSKISKIPLGSEIHSIFFKSDKEITKNLTFIFSKNLIVKNKNFISDIIFGFSLKCYSFDKYKKNKNSNLSIILNLYKLSLFKEISVTLSPL